MPRDARARREKVTVAAPDRISFAAGTSSDQGAFMRAAAFPIVVSWLVAASAAAHPGGDRGSLISVGSGACVGGRGRPAAEACEASDAKLVPLPGGQFLIRGERGDRCLFSNHD